MSFNGDGQRVSKTYNGTTTEYFYNGEILAGQKTGDDVIVFMYDNNGDAFGFIYNETEYYYVKNAQNDIIAIADSDGTVIANYYYDAWGKPEGITGNTEIANLNPLRYRSYYYDTESALYYLNTRYYSADICRFINADNQLTTGNDITGMKLFSYCGNNPVNRIDTSGNFWKKIGGLLKRVGNAIKGFANSIFKKSNVKSMSANSLPKTGEPGSSQTLPNPDGTPKQKRWYGPDGGAVRDRDYNHPGNVPFPHDHEWKDGKRQKEHLPPSPDYKISLEPIIGIAIVTICVIAIAIVAADDVTGVGVVDDVLYGPLGAGVGKGLIMIFG